jgi:hypothetical protein
MPAWISITAADLREAKVAALVDALASAALGDGQSDPTPGVIADVVARVRAEVQGCKSNVVDADSTLLPAELKSLAVRMIVRQLTSRLQIALTDDERTEQRNDLDYLKRIAACEVPISVPLNPLASPAIQPGAGSPRVEEPRRHFTHRAAEGL